MPLRRSAPRRRLIRRRRMARRPIRRMIPRNPNVHNFKRKLFLQDYIAVSGTQVAGATQFTISDLPSSTDFTNLFDQYRINKIVWKLIPKYTEVALVPGSATQNANLQQIHSVLDYDDATAPTSISQLTQYQNHKMTRGNQVHTRVLIPKVETMVNGASNAPKSYVWIDCDDTTVFHRGVKFIVPSPGTTGTTLYYDAEFTFYISCKNVR